MIFKIILCAIIFSKSGRGYRPMRNLNLDWCYEGGCTHIDDADTIVKDEPNTAQLEEMYREPCIGMFD